MIQRNAGGGVIDRVGGIIEASPAGVDGLTWEEWRIRACLGEGVPLMFSPELHVRHRAAQGRHIGGRVDREVVAKHEREMDRWRIRRRSAAWPEGVGKGSATRWAPEQISLIGCPKFALAGSLSMITGEFICSLLFHAAAPRKVSPRQSLAAMDVSTPLMRKFRPLSSKKAVPVNPGSKNET